MEQPVATMYFVLVRKQSRKGSSSSRSELWHKGEEEAEVATESLATKSFVTHCNVRRKLW